MEIHDLKKFQSLARSLFGVLFATLAFQTSPLFATVADGYIVKVEGASVYLDWGKSSGVTVGDTFDVYRSGDELKHPVSGESLGRSQSVLVQGVIESIDEKFSVARVHDPKGVIRTGDRIRLKTPAPAAVAPVTSLTIAPQNALPVPQEIWRSEPMKHDSKGMAIGDIDGDHKPDLVVAYRYRLEVYRWHDGKLEYVTHLESRTYQNLLAVDIADIDHSGKNRIYASYFMEGSKRAKTVVLEFNGKSLDDVGLLDGFVRNVERAGDKRELIGQDVSLAREFLVRQPAYIVKQGSEYKEGEPVKFSHALRRDQLFGYSWGDWDQDGSEDFAVLQSGERLKMFLKGRQWSPREVYGGSRSDFNWEEQKVASVLPRMGTFTGTDGRPQFVVPHNIQSAPLRFARYKNFKDSELISHRWNGAEMVPVWTLPIAGAISDFQIGDVMQKGSPQLWVAAVNSGDKTILLAYQIP